MKNNSLRKLSALCFTLGLMLLITGVSYSFFIYYKTGLYTHTITGGKIQVVYDEVTKNNILIENAYPRTNEEALTYGLEFEFAVTGYNESEKHAYYAIEMDHGDDVTGMNRFLDSDIKLTLYENEKLVFENEIFDNLDNQDIHYGTINYGTSSESPLINNYKLRLWINDCVIISDTLSNDLTTWNVAEQEWLEETYPDKYYEIANGTSSNIEDYGISIYTSEEFSNSYANFKVNVKADLTYDDIDYLTYDANGGEYTPKKSNLLTNRVTLQKPVKEGKGFLGWSSDPLATIPEYLAGEYYSGNGQMLYAVYGDTVNVMVGTWPEEIYSDDVVPYITEVYFLNSMRSIIDERYDNAEIKADLTLDNQGSVKGWIEEDIEGNYILYIGSVGTTYLSDGYALFAGWSGLNKIDFSNVDTSMVTDMSYMFSIGQIPSVGSVSFNDKKESLDDTSNDTKGDYKVEPMFINIPDYSTIDFDLTCFNTSKVTDMSYMFSNIGGVLDLSFFDTGNVTNMSHMFYMIGGEYLDISNFDTSNVTDMSWMFNRIADFSEFDLSHFNTSKVTNMTGMFWECIELDYLDISDFDTSSVTNMQNMFEDCFGDAILDVSNWDTSKVTDMSDMFYQNSLDDIIGLENISTENVTDMSGMFKYSGFEVIDFSNKNMSNVTTMREMFYQVDAEIIRLRNCVTNPNADIFQIFHPGGSPSTIKELDFSGSTNLMQFRFIDLFRRDKEIIVEKMNFDNASFACDSLSHMFEGCENLKEVSFVNTDFSNVTDAYRMFFDCDNLTTIYSNSDWSTEFSINSSEIFYYCLKLVGAIAFSYANVGIEYANPDTGYFTRKAI